MFFLDSGFLLVSGFLPSIFKPDGFCRHSWSFVEFFVVPVSLCPPPLVPLMYFLLGLLMLSPGLSVCRSGLQDPQAYSL